jgi:hypothetical protein
MQQGLTNAAFRGGPGFSIELIVAQGEAGMDDLEIRPDIMLKQFNKISLGHIHHPVNLSTRQRASARRGIP